MIRNINRVRKPCGRFFENYLSARDFTARYPRPFNEPDSFDCDLTNQLNLLSGV